MRARYLPLLILLLFLCSCGTASPPAPTSPPASQPASSPGLAAATETSGSEEASIPTEPPVIPSQPVVADFYRLRVEYLTTSDWSDLVLLTPEHVLSLRTMEVKGQPTWSQTSLEDLALNQPLEAAEAGQRVGLVVDYALDPQGLSTPLEFRLKKGDIGGSTVRVFQVTEAEPVPLQTVNHAGVVRNSGGENPLSFSLDLSELDQGALFSQEVRSVGSQRLLWAFYYPWYTTSSWWIQSNWLKDQPLENYSSSNPDTILRQVEEAQSAGIDGFLSSWWGPGSDTDQNLRKLLAIAEEQGFLVAIYFETLAGENGEPLPEYKIQSWLAYAIGQYGDHPAYFQVDGKPLIVVWASGAVPLEAWGRVFANLREEGMDALYLAMGYNPGSLQYFDGLHDYGVFTYQDLNQTYQTTSRAIRFYSLLEDDPTPRIWAATVQPGYDDTLQPTREGLVQERLEGDYYRFTWEAALASDPDWIIITSWNEWWEHTHIEPSQLYGDLYLQITREYADRWKAR